MMGTQHTAHAPHGPMTGLAAMLHQLPGARAVGDWPDAVLRVHTDTRSLLNSFLKANAKEQNYTYIDITKVMYDEAGNLRQDIFVEDKLHLNAEGYRLWTEVIKPYLTN